MTIPDKMTIQMQVVATRMNDGGLLGDGGRVSKSLKAQRNDEVKDDSPMAGDLHMTFICWYYSNNLHISLVLNFECHFLSPLLNQLKQG